MTDSVQPEIIEDAPDPEDDEVAEVAPVPLKKRPRSERGSLPGEIDRILWDLAHGFDADAIATGRCAIGSFEQGCAHRMPNVRDTLRAVRDR